MQWHDVVEQAGLRAGEVVVRRVQERPVAVFHTEDGLFAVDNRCPHEGYPLAQGAVDGCTLTCCWHNYKFDLRDGQCIKGEEAVDSFAVRVHDGTVQVAFEEVDVAAEQEKRWASLHTALWEGRTGQGARDAVRLLQLGVTPATLCGWVAAFDGRHCEWGSSHALPVAADAVVLAERFEGPAFVRLWVQAMDLASETHVRRPARAVPAAVDPGPDPVAAGERFAALVEAEDAAAAESLVLGGLAKGWGRAELEPWFWAPICAHFLSFGHRLIYTAKVFDLLDASGWAFAPDVLGGHVLGLVNGTREDVLPPYRAFNKRLAAVDLDATWARVGTNPDWDGAPGLEAALLGGKPAAAFLATQQALDDGAPLMAVVDVLVQAASERILRFDPAIDRTTDVQDGWLSVTHCLTGASALRVAVQRHPRPQVLRVVHHIARMIHHHRVLDSEAGLADPLAGTVVELEEALSAKDAVRAVGLARTLPREAVVDVLLALSVSDELVAPIVSAHAIKTLLVAVQEDRDERPLWATVRWLASPGRQRWTRRNVEDALRFVLEGKTPRLLAP